MSEILVNEYRGNIVENVRRGYVCVVNENKEIIFRQGDVNHYVYFRSAAKPVQILPVLKRKLDLKYNFTEPQTVIMASAHNGESYHIEALAEMLVKAGFIELDMVMKPTYPLDQATTDRLIREGLPQRKIYHNCAGKHIALMMLAREYGPDYQNYWRIEHPAQQEILEDVSLMTEVPKQKLEISTDGCGVPVYAVPIKNMAIMYLKLACPDKIKVTEIKNALNRFLPLVNKYNKFIRGTNRLCSVLNEDENIICEDAAGGVVDIGLKKEKMGIAIKIEDGCENDIVIAQVIIHLLEKLNYDNKNTIERLKTLYPDTIYNDNDIEIGKRIAVF